MAASIVIFAGAIRLDWSGVNRALWPDEAVYLLGARGFAGLADYELPAARPVLLPLLGSLAYRAGLGEPAIRLAGVAASLLSVYLAWRLGRRLVGAGEALGASFGLAVCWLDVFLSERVLTDGPALTLWLLALHVLVRSQLETPGRGALWLGPILGLLLLVRLGSVVLLPVLALLLAIARGRLALRDARLWASAGLGLLVFLPYLIWCTLRWGSPLAPLLQREAAVSETYAARVPTLYASGLRPYLEWLPTLYLDPATCALLAIGSGVVAVELVRARDADARRRAAILLAWPVATLLALAILIGHAESRFALPFLPAAFLLVMRGLCAASNLAARRSRVASVLIVALPLAWIGHHQLVATGEWMLRSARAYEPNRAAGAWLGEHARPGATVYAAEPEINQYYSGLRSRWIPEARARFEAELARTSDAYLVVQHRHASQPEWVPRLVRERGWRPLFAAPARGVPALRVYRVPRAPGAARSR